MNFANLLAERNIYETNTSKWFRK